MVVGRPGATSGHVIGTNRSPLDRLWGSGSAPYHGPMSLQPATNATARSERAELCDLLLEVGPDAPTLCAGWTARDLAAHLVIREGRPDAAAGIVVGPLAGYTKRVQDQIAREDYGRLVKRVRGGPPIWTLLWIGPLDAAINTLEFFVHHEDVRRARDSWAPRELPEPAITQLWSGLSRGGKVIARRLPVGVVVRPTDGPKADIDLRLRDGSSSVTLVGPVGECILALHGRPTHGLTIDGTAVDVAAFRSEKR